VHSTIWQPEGSQASGLYWPFATIIYKGDSVAIFIRCGTLCHSVVPGSAVLCCAVAQLSAVVSSAVLCLSAVYACTAHYPQAGLQTV
jgi:hypothetical protein